jgi:hypothetical protein
MHNPNPKENKMSKMKFHPLANLFPMIEGKPFEDLTQDIKLNGLRDKIVTLEGEILEGRNRYNGCLAAGVEPEFKEFSGKDPAAFVWSKNGVRRHLSQSQLATIGAEIAIHIREEAPEEGQPAVDTAQHAAETVGVSKRSVERAVNLKKTSPKKFAKVKKGKVSLNAASKPDKTAQEKADQDHAENVKRIGKICGMSFAHAVQVGTILKTRIEVKRYADLEDEDMERLKLLVQQGWPVGKAKKFKMVSLSRAHKIKDLLDRAAAQGGTFELTIEGWQVTVKKK